MSLVQLYNEKELLASVSLGDEKAFHVLYYHYSPRIYSNLLKLVKSADLAQELLQQVFVNIWLRHEAIDPEKSFRSYLFTTANNLVIDFYRKVKRDKLLMDKLLAAAQEYYLHTEEWLHEKETMHLIQAAINDLPPQRKIIFTLCKLENRTYKEVSELLGISPATVNSQIVKATSTIQKKLMANRDVAGILLAYLILR
ncbi:sigma-70 family RNA polymerase sigma factor [Chitinophaga ginsengisegetis]|uniref:RNA polymerase sigma factor n=1 Tax=Chitinophaga ginsengisegetis TaxID=393003 RepID=UPI003438C6D3